MASIALVALWGCGSDSSGQSSLPEGGPGTHMLSFEHDGVTREAIVYVPQSYSSDEAAPLLFNFHGFGGTAADYMEWADMRPLADEYGFLLVYPQGSLLDGASHWNSAAPSADNKSDADDFGFVERLIDTIAAPFAVDANRVYAAGYSSGAMMAFGLACYRSDRIAAVAAVSGTMLDDIGVSCTPSHPTSVITLHGTSDAVLPYDGGAGMFSAQGIVDYWTDLDHITAAPTTGSSDDDGTQVDFFAYAGGDNGTEVQHFRVAGGEHVWFDVSVDGVPANRVVWEFLSRFGRDGAL